MKKLFTILLLLVGFIFVLPGNSSAHMGGVNMMPTFGSGSPVSVEEFEDVQGVMIKMMNGETLTAEETEQMFDFMQNHQIHHAAFNPMMMGYVPTQDGYGMPMMNSWMTSGIGTFGQWILTVTTLVWLFVGILVSLYLIKQLSNSRK